MPVLLYSILGKAPIARLICSATSSKLAHQSLLALVGELGDIAACADGPHEISAAVKQGEPQSEAARSKGPLTEVIGRTRRSPPTWLPVLAVQSRAWITHPYNAAAHGAAKRPAAHGLRRLCAWDRSRRNVQSWKYPGWNRFFQCKYCVRHRESSEYSVRRCARSSPTCSTGRSA